MGRVLRVLLVVAGLLTAGTAWSGNTVPFGWGVGGADVTGTGDSLRVAIRFSFSGSVQPREAVIFSPVVSRGEFDVTLRPLVLKGRKVVTGSVSGSSDEISPSVGSESYEYVFSIPRREWMDTCSVSVVESTYTKKTGIRYRSRRACGTYARPSEPNVALPWNFMEPEADTRATRAVEFPVVLSVSEGAKAVRESFGDNAAEIRRLDSLVRPFFHGRGPKVKSLALEAFTAPAGSEKANMALTKSRLSSLQKLLAAKGTFGRIRPVQTPRGEDWDGLVGWVLATDRADDMRLHEIVTGRENPDSLEDVLRREKPAVWEELVALCFPLLERYVCRVEYSPVMYLTADDAIAAYNSCPAFLSARDFWVVISSLPSGSGRWCDAVLEAVALHPEDEATRTNAVFALTDMGYLKEASVWLRDCGSSSEAVLARAIWMYRMGMYEDCIPLFESLKGKGGVYDLCWTSVDAWWKWNTGNLAWEMLHP